MFVVHFVQLVHITRGMVSVTCTPHIEEARGAWPLKAPLYYQSRRLFHTICDRVTTSVVNKGASVSTIFGVLTSAMCKWQQPFRVSGSHVKSSQCKINAFFFFFQRAELCLREVECLRSHLQILPAHARSSSLATSEFLHLSEVDRILNEDIIIIIIL